MAETGQPYAFSGDDPLNETDPLGLSIPGGPGGCPGPNAACLQKTGPQLAPVELPATPSVNSAKPDATPLSSFLPPGNEGWLEYHPSASELAMGAQIEREAELQALEEIAQFESHLASMTVQNFRERSSTAPQPGSYLYGTSTVTDQALSSVEAYWRAVAAADFKSWSATEAVDESELEYEGQLEGAGLLLHIGMLFLPG